MWTVDYEADIASDLSAFHRIDDPMQIDGPRYFSLVTRLAAYTGVIAARAMALREEGGSPASEVHSAARGAPERPAAVSNDVAFAMLSGEGWIEHTTEEVA